MVLMIFALVVSYYMYKSSVDMIEKTVGIVAKEVAINARDAINMNHLKKVIIRTKALKNESESGKILQMPEYREIRSLMWKYKKEHGVKFIYIMTKNKDNKPIYVIDGFPLDYKESDLSLPGTVENIPYPLMLKTLNKKIEFGSQLNNDKKWGSNITVSIPLRTYDGKFLGLLGVDIEAKEIITLMENQKREVILFAIVVLIITLIIVYVLNKFLFRHFKILTSKINEFKKGNLSVRSNIKTKDEIGELSESFDEMVNIFYDNNFSIDKLICDLSKAYKLEELERTIINEFSHIASFDAINILEFRNNSIDFKESDTNIISLVLDAIKKNYAKLKISDFLVVENCYIFLVGRIKSGLKFLLIKNSTKLSQRDILSVQLLSRYTSIYYENLDLIEEMSKKIITLENQSTSILTGKLLLRISEKERKRLASDLHDDVLQEIIRSKKSLSNTINLANTDQNNFRHILKNIEVDFINIANLIRETCNELYPSLLIEKGVVNSVENYIEKIQLRINIVINFAAFNIKSNLNYEESLTVYRIVQELISNAIAHSKCTDLDIMLREDSGTFIIYYCDNGIGMDLNNNVDKSKHLGLHSIKERIKSLSGEINCISEIGKGLEVSCRFPIEEATKG